MKIFWEYLPPEVGYAIMQSFLDARLAEQRRGPKNTDHYIFTDSDMAVVGDLGEIFHKHPNFHLALTFRNNKAQPLNSGFIAVRGTEDGILRYMLCTIYLLYFFCIDSLAIYV